MNPPIPSLSCFLANKQTHIHARQDLCCNAHWGYKVRGPGFSSYGLLALRGAWILLMVQTAMDKTFSLASGHSANTSFDCRDNIDSRKLWWHSGRIGCVAQLQHCPS